jgi:hypothetical protein
METMKNACKVIIKYPMEISHLRETETGAQGRITLKCILNIQVKGEVDWIKLDQGRRIQW